MMRNSTPLSRSRLGGRDLDASIDLHRIEIYNLTIEAQSKVDTKRGLA